MSITAWSTTASQNGNRLNSGNFLEGQAPSTLNDGSRDVLASIRAWANDIEWYEFGTGSNTTTYTRVSATSISIPLDVTAQFEVNRRVKIVDGTGSTRYGRVESRTFSSPNTTITFDFDSSNLGSGNPTSVKYGIISPTNTSLPAVNPVGSIVMYGGGSAPSGWLFCDGSSVAKTSYASLFTILGNTYGTATATNFYLPNLQAKFPLGKSGSHALGSTGGAFAQTPSGSVSQPTFTGSAFTPTGSVSLSGTVANHTLTEAQLPNITGTVEFLARGGAGSNQYIQRNLTGAFSDSGNGSNYGVGWFGESGSNSRKLTYSFGSGQAHDHSFSGSASFSGSSGTPSGTISTPTYSGSSLDTTNPYQVVNYIIKF